MYFRFLNASILYTNKTFLVVEEILKIEMTPKKKIMSIIAN